MCNILAAVLAKTPKGALRSKFAASSQILMRVAEQHLPEVAALLRMTCHHPCRSSQIVTQANTATSADSCQGFRSGRYRRALMRQAQCLQANVIKAVITCLGQLTAAVDPTQWPGAVRPFGLLLQLLLDERPKVRKRAQDAAQSVLAALQDTAARQPASDTVLKSMRNPASLSMTTLVTLQQCDKMYTFSL